MRSIAEVVKNCHICQMFGKPNPNVNPVQLNLVPAFGEPFSRVIIDFVVPIPKRKSKHSYLLIMMCPFTSFRKLFLWGRYHPWSLARFDQLFHSIWYTQRNSIWPGFQFHIRNISTSNASAGHPLALAYHPQSQGALKRYHQTLKIKINCVLLCIDLMHETNVNCCSLLNVNHAILLICIQLYYDMMLLMICTEYFKGFIMCFWHIRFGSSLLHSFIDSLWEVLYSVVMWQEILPNVRFCFCKTGGVVCTYVDDRYVS